MNKLFEKPMFPILGVVLLLFVYGFFDQAVIHCGGARIGLSCSAVKANNAFGVTINSEDKDFEKLKTLMDAKDAELRKQLELKPTTEPEKESHAALLLELKTDSSNIRQEIASRYSSRLGWTFLTAVFFLLSFSAIVLSIVIIRDSVVKTMRWIAVTSVVAGLFAIIMFTSQVYMRILRELYSKTVFGGYDLPFPLLNFSNVFGFAATIFLVVAVSAILFSVEEKETEEETVADYTARQNAMGELSTNATKLATAASITLAEKYEKQMNNLKFVLYLGGAMLFVAVLQLNTLAEWHKAFLPPEFSTAVSSLHLTFFKSSIAFQAGIYTIMLGVLYLPAAYIIKQKADALKRLGVLPAGNLADKGLGFSFWDFLPKLLTILSPFLATSALELIKYLSVK
jgi:hypothetical protein